MAEGYFENCLNTFSRAILVNFDIAPPILLLYVDGYAYTEMNVFVL